MEESSSSFGYHRWSEPRKVSWALSSLAQRVQHAREHSTAELSVFKSNWRVIVIGLLMQYVHSVATNVAYYMHIQREPLADLGFALLPQLTPAQQPISEVVFFTLFLSTIAFALFYPWLDLSRQHLSASKRLYTTLIAARFLAVAALAQALRIVSFLVTSLPGPNYHCRPNSKHYDPPTGLYDIFTSQDPFTHCGDLVFSSHTIFAVLCVLTWNKYANLSLLQRLASVLFLPVIGLLIIAARKHYTLDVVVAWYTVPLLWIAHEKYYPDTIPPELSSTETFAAEEIQTLSGSADAPPGELPREVRVNDNDVDDLEMGRV